ncbi:lytic transglycosylase domain-containing protein [Herbivorax sp. ANBcel31]|uniref:lytic transglycosylase domain-containing protein n=1 Tax=Herbivorax sp. ANBcel31 TaxID=3069754 RepID=UPI0027AF65BF|nr:lytic transglycosylase domain-containing protein [Herbivorax sp. ANBcel31]MDQ2085272.1 lytic transglycosylase domain-containing protein [Herbivorax sp. ANBcel31]
MLNKTKKRISLFVFLILLVILIVFTVEVAVKFLYPIEYKEYVLKYSSYYENLDPYLVFSVIKAESNFEPNATSHKNARGLMQITDDTSIWIAERMKMDNFKIEHLYNPETNIKMGCWYLNNLIEEFMYEDGVYIYEEEPERRKLVLAAYNAGRGNVALWLKDIKFSESGKSLDVIPFKETDRYVDKVHNYYEVYKKLYKENF